LVQEKSEENQKWPTKENEEPSQKNL